MGASHLGKALEGACAVAATVCMAVGLAPFASADDTAADAAQLPDHNVNGDFEYQHDWFREHAAYGWTAVIPSTGLNWNARTKSYQPGPDDWNEARFGWHSTQVDGTNGEPGEQRAGARRTARDSPASTPWPRSSPPSPTRASTRTSA